MDSYQPYRRKRSNSNGVSPVPFIFLVLAVIAAGIFAFSPIGTQIRDRVLLPLMHSVVPSPSAAPVEQAMAITTPAPEAEQSAAPVAETTVMVKKQPYYILQMGSYDAESDAQLVSNELQSMGGGGFVYHKDGLYRLFAAAYTDPDSLKTVQAQIRRDGFMNEAFITESASVQILVKGDEQAVELFQSAVKHMERVPNDLCSIALRYDKNELNKDAVRKEIVALEKETKSALDGLDLIDAQNAAAVKQTLTAYENALSTYLLGYDTIVSEFYAGALRHLQLELILQYTDFFEGLQNHG